MFLHLGEHAYLAEYLMNPACDKSFLLEIHVIKHEIKLPSRGQMRHARPAAISGGYNCYFLFVLRQIRMVIT